MAVPVLDLVMILREVSVSVSHLRHNHSLPLYHPTCRSTAHLSSYSASVVPLQNRLPMNTVCAPSLYSFKKRLNFFNFLQLSNWYLCWCLLTLLHSVLSLIVLGKRLLIVPCGSNIKAH